VLPSKAARAAPGLIRHDPAKVSATGEQHGTFRLRNRKTQIPVRGHPDTLAAGKSSARHPGSPWHGEESDDYRHVIAVLNHGWRVVTCKNSIQWILQKRRGEQNRWRSQYFCCTREVLIRCVREYAGQIDGASLVVLLRLPERIGGAS
jgi:hypothetical protein